jgi:hypothetical protein
MSKLVYSLENPDVVKVDVVKNGSVRLLCRWDIHTVEIEIDGESHTEYAYQEEVIWWALPLHEYVERVDGRQGLTVAGLAYIANQSDAILGWAMAAGV